MNKFLKFDIDSNLRNMKTQQVSFPQVVEVGCGIDVHQAVIVATVRRSDNQYETRTFEAYTSSLKELREWCKHQGVTHVAMESTGIYWKPVYNILEECFEVILVNARHVKNIPGHKTDKKDSAWLSKLLLPALGRPIIAVRMPRRRIWPSVAVRRNSLVPSRRAPPSVIANTPRRACLPTAYRPVTFDWLRPAAGKLPLTSAMKIVSAGRSTLARRVLGARRVAPPLLTHSRPFMPYMK